MNLKAKCVNPNCEASGYERSVMVGQLTGFGAPNDRVICPMCRMLMRTTQTIAADEKRVGRRRSSRRVPPRRATGRRPSVRRTKPRSSRRDSGRR